MEADIALKDSSEFKISGKVAIVTTQWHHTLVGQMQKDALGVFDTQKNLSVIQREVMGTVELANAAYNLLSSAHNIDGIILMGAVIKGETPHFDYVCDIVSSAIASLNTSFMAPTIFGVLTVNSLEQAQDRVYGRSGHSPKGKLDALALLQQIETNAKSDNIH